MKRSNILALLLICFFLSNCTRQVLSYTSAKGQYQKGISAYYSGKYNTAEIELLKIRSNFNNSEYQNFAYLALADNHLRSRVRDSLGKSRAFYQTYLEQETNKSYIPYIFENFMLISLKNNANQIFTPRLRSDRANSYFQNIIDDYYRFALFYPQSAYFANATNYYKIATNYLANHEFEVANWYFSKKLYYSAILRYNYLLKNYTNFTKKQEAFTKLVESYKKANLFVKAKELSELKNQKL